MHRSNVLYIRRPVASVVLLTISESCNISSCFVFVFPAPCLFTFLPCAVILTSRVAKICGGDIFSLLEKLCTGSGWWIILWWFGWCSCSLCIGLRIHGGWTSCFGPSDAWIRLQECAISADERRGLLCFGSWSRDIVTRTVYSPFLTHTVVVRLSKIDCTRSGFSGWNSYDYLSSDVGEVPPAHCGDEIILLRAHVLLMEWRSKFCLISRCCLMRKRRRPENGWKKYLLLRLVSCMRQPCCW